MKKKLCCILLAAVVFFGLIPTPVYAMSGVDLSRIKFSEGEKRVFFKFGDLTEEGAIRQVFPFTEQEIEKIVLETLRDKKLTQLDLVELNRTVARARRAADFTQEDIDRIKQNLLTTIGTVPQAGDVSTVLGVINQYMSSNSWNDIGTVSSDLLANSMSDQVKETAKGYISDKCGEMGAKFVKTVEWKDNLLNVVNFCDMLADEYARDKQKWKDITEGANAKRTLNDFYEDLQDRIDNYKEKSNKKGWTINFDDAMTYRSFSFFSVDGNIQTWYLNIQMNQESPDEYGSIAGTYSGTYTITAEHDMSCFTSGIANAAPKMKPIKDFVQIMKSSPMIKPSFQKVSDGTVYISRTIGGTCKAEIDKSGEIQLTLNQDSDESTVEFNGISVDIILNTGTIADRYAKLSLRADIGNKEENVFVTFQTSNLDILIQGSVSDQSYGASGSGNAGWDENIWKPWDGTQKTLSLNP